MPLTQAAQIQAAQPPSARSSTAVLLTNGVSRLEVTLKVTTAILALAAGVYTYLGVRELLNGSPTTVFFAAVIYSVAVSVGIYSFDSNTFNLYLALLFGIVGYAFRKLDIPKAPLIFGIILGAKIEQSLRQAMTISSGDVRVFIESPLAASLLALAAGMIALSYWAKKKSAATLQQARAQAAH